MTTAEKTTKKDKGFKPSDEKVYMIPIAEIHSNSENPRESAPQLLQMGYGLFERQEGSDKPAVIPLALSSKEEDKKEYVKYIDRFEPSIAELARSMFQRGQIHAATVRPNPKKGGYDLIVGCRRLLAALYNACQSGLPAKLKCQVQTVNDDDALYMAFDENAHRMNMSPIEQARWFAKMRNAGMKPQEIAEATKIDHQTVRGRLELLKLDKDTQDKVHEGEIPYTKALKIAKGKADKSDPKATQKGGKGNGLRRSAPTIKDFEKMYNDRDDLDERVREFIAVEILECNYTSFKELQKMKKEHEEAEAKKKEKEKEGKDKK